MRSFGRFGIETSCIGGMGPWPRQWIVEYVERLTEACRRILVGPSTPEKLRPHGALQRLKNGRFKAPDVSSRHRVEGLSDTSSGNVVGGRLPATPDEPERVRPVARAVCVGAEERPAREVRSVELALPALLEVLVKAQPGGF